MMEGEIVLWSETSGFTFGGTGFKTQQFNVSSVKLSVSFLLGQQTGASYNWEIKIPASEAQYFNFLLKNDSLVVNETANCHSSNT